jgi:ribosomal protein L35
LETERVKRWRRRGIGPSCRGQLNTTHKVLKCPETHRRKLLKVAGYE